ncbi:MAG: type II toxin-antitoxin system RelE/ParE family toxin [Cyclobacteriaceae bacterium]
MLNILWFACYAFVVIGHGFQKKSQKTPNQEIARAEQIKKNIIIPKTKT